MDTHPPPLVTVAVPSLNQGEFVEEALESIFAQGVSVEVFVADGGSTDQSCDVFAKWDSKISGWRSHPDNGQAAAINESIAKGSAPYVCWLNSDDHMLPGGLECLLAALAASPHSPAAYGEVLNDRQGRLRRVDVEPFDTKRLARRCIISQPGTLIRREAWESVGGLREDLIMSMDYDLWWRLSHALGPLLYVSETVAVNRDHSDTKTRQFRRLHYRESMSVVRNHWGTVPFIWWMKIPYSVWLRGIQASWNEKKKRGECRD